MNIPVAIAHYECEQRYVVVLCRIDNVFNYCVSPNISITLVVAIWSNLIAKSLIFAFYENKMQGVNGQKIMLNI